MDSIDQSAKDLTVDQITYDYPKFGIEMKTIGGSYRAKVNAAASEMTGTWKQTGNLSLTLKRTATPDIVPEPLTAADCLPRKDSDLQGVWKAEFKLNNQTMPVELKVAEISAGSFRAEVTSSSIGMLLPASSVSYERPAVTMEFGGAGATFEGKIDNDNSRVSGTVNIGGKPQSVIFKRTDATADQAREAEKDYSHNGPNDLPGHWQGSLAVQKMKLRLKLDIAKLPGDQFDCTMFSLDQGAVPIPASAVDYNSPKVRLEWKTINGTFTGELKNGKLSGTWKQGGGSLPLVFDRVPGK